MPKTRKYGWGGIRGWNEGVGKGGIKGKAGTKAGAGKGGTKIIMNNKENTTVRGEEGAPWQDRQTTKGTETAENPLWSIKRKSIKR